MIIGSLPSGGPSDRMLLGIAGIFLSAWMICGYVKILLDYYDGKKNKIENIFTQFKYFWRVLGAEIILFTIIVLGLILFIIPGIYFALRFMFVIPLIVDKDLDISEAMKQSTSLTRGIKWPLLGFILVSFGIFILGALLFGVGILVAIPIIWLANINLYRSLLLENSVPAEQQ
ncbi:MAG TPA: glycerophosphoryl diester phosphodiesterase membrane domain-containing protein [Candidatus Moranbacteria bacterium]|nr:glycerophosphoryl diester phosphodiesterase membrane domain-containing protein [Candidatus Moranbacteria bacterium]HQB59621.1 glycerophosphoryl diester phosphodiesterase membrane domain-containing protein [Candidatus Moranbacteria bacterium]